MIEVHCKAHQTNLVVQTLFILHVVNYLKGVMVSFHKYLSTFSNRHLELVKLGEIMETKDLKVLNNVQTYYVEPI
jgi:hypothetical protein